MTLNLYFASTKASKRKSDDKIFILFVEIMFVTYRPRLGQEEATEGLGTGNDDLNYLITHHRGLVVPQLMLPGFVITPLISICINGHIVITDYITVNRFVHGSWPLVKQGSDYLVWNDLNSAGSVKTVIKVIILFVLLDPSY